MKKLIQIIDKRMLKFSSNIKSLKENIDRKQCSKEAFEIIKTSPDSADYNLVLSTAGEDYKDDIEYITKFQGWMEEYKEEQIKIAIEKLNNILSVIDIKLTKELNELTVELNNIEEKNNQYKLLRERLSSYNNKTYIEENEFKIICDIINEIDEEIAITLLQTIGKNNAFIELEKRGQLELIESLNGKVDLDILEEMNKNRNSNEVPNDIYSCEYINKKIEESINYLKKIDIEPILYEYVNNTFERFNILKNKLTKELIEEANIFKDDIDSIEQYEMYSIAVILLLIDLIDSKNYEEINEVYLSQKDNIFFRTISEEEQKIIDKCKKSLMDIFDEYYDDDFYTKFCHSYSSFDSEVLPNYADAEIIQSVKIMNIINSNSSNIDRMTLDELISLEDELNREITLYKDILSKEEIEEDSKIDGLDIDDVSNFIIIRDTDYLLNNINELLTEYKEVKPSLFTSALSRLYMMTSTELFERSKCKPIIHDSNMYDIHEDRAGCIRILFRTFYTKEGRVFYEVLSFAYGSCGPIKKTKNLIESVKEYSRNYDEYISLESEFKNSNTEVMNKYITEGLNLYNELIFKEKEKKKEFGLND